MLSNHLTHAGMCRRPPQEVQSVKKQRPCSCLAPGDMLACHLQHGRVDLHLRLLNILQTSRAA